MSCGIYKIENLINHKIYIGKSKNIEKRWKDHRCAKDNCTIHKAIQKYGVESFDFSIVEEASEELLDELKKKWISYYNSYEEGYNETRGGEGASHMIKLTDNQVKQIQNDLINTKILIKDLGKKYNVSTKTISDINVGKSRIDSNLEYPLRENKYKKVKITKDQLLKDLIENQGNFELVGKKYNVSSQTIRERCKEYKMSTEKEKYMKEKREIKLQPYHSTRIASFDIITHKKIKEYNSIREAARDVNASPESIRKALTSKSHISFGYKWEKV